MTDFVPDSVWIYAGSDGGWTDTGEWSCDVEPDCAHYWPHIKMLAATPARVHAEELLGALRVIVESWDWWQVDTYDRDQSVPGDAVYDARALIARIEGAKP